ncbi:MAG: hypothetical protein QOH93_3432, partial [Chloroflexia bacterium]|nr:hypothetical protein [Chloroflexia bacterium]
LLRLSLRTVLLGSLVMISIGIVLLLMLSLLVSGFEAWMRVSQQPPALPALYHNAQSLAQLITNEGQDSISPVRTVTFSTPDSLDVVKEHYESSMQALGWAFYGYPFDDAPATQYYQYWPDDGPVYKVAINIVPTEGNMTLVTMKMYSIGHSWHGELPTK